MFQRRVVSLLAIAAILAVVSLGSARVEASTAARPLKGDFAGSGFSFQGELTHLGKFTGQITSFTPSPTGGTTTAVWTAANGDTVNVTSVFTVTGPGTTTGYVAFQQVITINSGTGRFTGATGSATAIGETKLDFSDYFGTINGTIGY